MNIPAFASVAASLVLATSVIIFYFVSSKNRNDGNNSSAVNNAYSLDSLPDSSSVKPSKKKCKSKHKKLTNLSVASNKGASCAKSALPTNNKRSLDDFTDQFPGSLIDSGLPEYNNYSFDSYSDSIPDSLCYSDVAPKPLPESDYNMYKINDDDEISECFKEEDDAMSELKVSFIKEECFHENIK